MATTTETPKQSGGDNSGYIFRPYITLPSGKVLWARNYGLRAFRIPVSDNDNKTP